MAPRASGNFLLRVDPLLHVALKERATRQGLSLNEFCERTLRAALRGARGKDSDDPVIGAILDEYRDLTVQGILLFGSAARAELTQRSDIDLLIVVQGAIERALYRRWDDSEAIRQAVAGQSHPVSPQFVHLPSDARQVGGIWLEAAIEGRVLWDPESRVHGVLTGIRRAILDGVFERAVSHGHPYWIRKKAV